MKVTCYDEDLIVHAMVGQRVYQAQDLVGNEIWLSLDFKGEEALKVLLDTKCMQSSNDSVAKDQKHLTIAAAGDAFARMPGAKWQSTA